MSAVPAVPAADACTALADMLHDYRETGCALEPAACQALYAQLALVADSLSETAWRVRAACVGLDRIRKRNAGSVDGLSWELAAARLRECADALAEESGGGDVIPFDPKPAT